MIRSWFSRLACVVLEGIADSLAGLETRTILRYQSTVEAASGNTNGKPNQVRRPYEADQGSS